MALYDANVKTNLDPTSYPIAGSINNLIEKRMNVNASLVLTVLYMTDNTVIGELNGHCISNFLKRYIIILTQIITGVLLIRNIGT